MDYYLPSVKAGGPVTTIANLVARLGGDYAFKVVTADRDLGDTGAFSNTESETWTSVGAAEVLRLPPGSAGVKLFSGLLRDVRPSVLYLNSFWSRRSTLLPLLARRQVEPTLPTVLAPRGEFTPGALTLKPLRKRLYLAAMRLSGLGSGLIWQASSDYEANDIRNMIGKGARIRVAPDLTAPLPPEPVHPRKTPGRLLLALVGRVSPMKNVEGAIAMLSDLKGQVGLTVYGPEEDPSYAQTCRRAAAELPPNVSVVFAGARTPAQVQTALASADALLLPSRGENFGHAIFESMGVGTPVVISDRTPWHDLETAGAGWDLPLESPERFTEVLQRLVDMDQAAMARLRAGARYHAESVEREDWRVEANRQLFDKVLACSLPESD